MWFVKLPPEMQVALVAQLVGIVFSWGVYWATVRFLSKEVKEIKERDVLRDEKIEEHSVDIATLKARP